MNANATEAWLPTFRGIHFDLLNPQTQMVNIKDIAHALAMTCRWGGQCRTFYSVAQHSLMVSRAVPPEHAMLGLLHDAPEAYVGDVITPLKHILPGYAAIEERVWKCIADRFEVPSVLSPEVKRADIRALATEFRMIGSGAGVWDVTPYLDGEPPLEWMEPLEPARAEAQFLKRFVELTTNRL